MYKTKTGPNPNPNPNHNPNPNRSLLSLLKSLTNRFSAFT